MALKYFAESEEAINQAAEGEAIFSAKQIAEITHTPYEVTARVLQVLSSHGVLKAEYGTQGGYRLIKNLAHLSVHDLMKMIEGSTELAKCLSTEKECDLSEKCTIVSPIQKLNNKVQNFYKSISVEEVLHV